MFFQKKDMDKIKFPVITASLFLLVYTMGSVMGMPYPLVAGMFSISPIVVIWMVYRVLKDADPSQKTFSNYWYEDNDIVKPGTS